MCWHSDCDVSNYHLYLFLISPQADIMDYRFIAGSHLLRTLPLQLPHRLHWLCGDVNFLFRCCPNRLHHHSFQTQAHHQCSVHHGKYYHCLLRYVHLKSSLHHRWCFNDRAQSIHSFNHLNNPPSHLPILHLHLRLRLRLHRPNLVAFAFITYFLLNLSCQLRTILSLL